MSQKKIIYSLIVIAALAIMSVGIILYDALQNDQSNFIDPADQALVVQGQGIYMNYCAACHGGALQGQPNWRARMSNGKLPAPPHDKTGHTWHHPDSMLVDMVRNGLVPGETAPLGYLSDMPAYGAILSDEEIIAVIAYIKSTWPEDVLEAQKEVTLHRQN